MADFFDPAVAEDLGDGLFRWCGDIFCTYPLIRSKVSDSSVIYDYGVYTVTVSWTNSDGYRTNPQWVRKYPETSGGDG